MPFRLHLFGRGSDLSIFGVSEGGTLSLLFAHTHPDRAQALVLYGSWARRLAAPDYPWGVPPEELDTYLARMGDAWATGEWWNTADASPYDDERHRKWWARYWNGTRTTRRRSSSDLVRRAHTALESNPLIR
jgi:pimeloyl-ACP methyl ester carboxylesterase